MPATANPTCAHQTALSTADVEAGATCTACRGVCEGRGGRLWRVLLAPGVVAFNYVRHFLLPCVGVLLGRLFACACYHPARLCGHWPYVDPDDETTKWTDESEDAVTWRRAHEVVNGGPLKEGDPKPKLFSGGIAPSDLKQGQLGDCWLIAALASAAEYRQCIQRCFRTLEYNPRGKYDFLLWDGQLGKWTHLSIDDTIPCHKNTYVPLYAKPNGELWAILLEKAFAKFCGGYHKLDGGHSMWAWKAMTGDHCFSLSKKGERVERQDMVNDEKDTSNKRAVRWYRGDAVGGADQLWVLLMRYTRARALIACSFDESEFSDAGGGRGQCGEAMDKALGLVGSHAYSILEAVELNTIFPGIGKNVRLVKCRNPWARKEWKGAWSDDSAEWEEHSIVRMRLRPEFADDGVFWMPYEDFFRFADDIDICDRTTTQDLHLEVHEDMGCHGVAYGLLKNTFTYFLLCRSCRVLYCGETTTGVTRSTERGPCGVIV